MVKPVFVRSANNIAARNFLSRPFLAKASRGASIFDEMIS
jgi:hypothetical protein